MIGGRHAKKQVVLIKRPTGVTHAERQGGREKTNRIDTHTNRRHYKEATTEHICMSTAVHKEKIFFWREK